MSLSRDGRQVAWILGEDKSYYIPARKTTSAEASSVRSFEASHFSFMTPSIAASSLSLFQHFRLHLHLLPSLDSSSFEVTGSGGRIQEIPIRRLFESRMFEGSNSSRFSSRHYTYRMCMLILRGISLCLLFVFNHSSYATSENTLRLHLVSAIEKSHGATLLNRFENCCGISI